MHDPEVLILDEPTSGLDPVMQQVFIDFIKEEKKRGKTILLSSHIFNEVELTCDRIAIIKDGKIVSEFDTNEIKHNENKTFIIKFENKANLNKFCKNLPKLTEKSKIQDDIYLKEIDDEKNIAFVTLNDKNIDKLVSLISDYNIELFKQDKFTLEDYFMNFYKEDKNFGGVL